MPLTPEQIKAISSRAAGSVLASKPKPAGKTRTPREQELWAQGEELLQQLGNGLGYRGPWLPYGPEGDFLGHYFNDDAVTKTSLVCQDLEDCKAGLIRVRKEYNAEPPVFNQQEVPGISGSLEYTVVIVGDKAIKTPKPGHGYGGKVESDFNKLKQLGDLAPETEYDSQNNRLVQKVIQGRFATEDELLKIRQLIEAKGLIPRGLTTQDVIITDRGEFKVVDVGMFEYAEGFTKQENVNPCPNLQPMSEWIKGETPGTCRPCILTPVVQWYWQELKEQGFEEIAAQLEAEVNVLEEDNVEQVMAMCKDLDEIKAGVPAELRKRLEEFDCTIQSFDPAEVSAEESTVG